MRKKKKFAFIIFFVLVLMIFVIVPLHNFTYNFDRQRIESNLLPKYCIKLQQEEKFGYTYTKYIGIGYEIIKFTQWGTAMTPNGPSGTSYSGYEIYRFPQYVSHPKSCRVW
jgi:hypothetical protein